MTLKTIEDALHAWYEEHKYDLLRGRVELTSKFVGDELAITLATFPDPDTQTRRSVGRRLTLPMLHRDPVVRTVGLGVYLHLLVDEMGAELEPPDRVVADIPPYNAGVNDADRMRSVRDWLMDAGVEPKPLGSAPPTEAFPDDEGGAWPIGFEMPPVEDMESEVQERILPPERRDEIDPADVNDEAAESGDATRSPGKLERTGGPGVTARPA